MKRHIFFLVVMLLFTAFSFAQSVQDEIIPRSGTRIVMEEALKDPEKKQILDQLEIFTQEFISNIDNHRMGGPYIIPLVVHVIHDYEDENISYEQVDYALSRMNEDFQGLNDDLSEVVDSFTSVIGFPNFEFRLATKDPDGNCTYGVNRVASPWAVNSETQRTMSIANWDDKKYINIYIVRSFEESMSSAAAYAVKPGSGGDNGDYIFFRYDYFGDWNFNNDSPGNNQYRRHVPTHEMGHFMNLDHPWGGNNDAAQEDNCALDDGVEDTPETIGTIGECNLEQATCDGSLDNVQNFMEYSNCICMFTQGQADRMLAAANSLAGNRWYLWQEENLIATGTDDESFTNDPYADCAPIPDFKVGTELGCSGTSISFENFTYNYRDTEITYSWSFDGATPSESNSENPVVQYQEPGTYSVILTACKDDNCNTLVKENAVTILSQMDVTLAEGLSQGFESATFPDMVSEVWWGGVNHGEQHWERTELASSEGVAAMKIKSQNYNYNREAHSFSTPELNLSEFTTSSGDPLMLCFDIAYAKRLPYDAVSFNEQGGVEDVFSIHNDALIVSYKGCDNDAQWSERPWISTRAGQEGAFPSQQQSLFTVFASDSISGTVDTDGDGEFDSNYKIHFNSFVPQPGSGYYHYKNNPEGEWGQRCITIQQLAGDDAAVIKFDFIGTGQDMFDLHWVDDGVSNLGELITATSIGGNWLYLDNILIGNQSQIQQVESVSRTYEIENLSVTPNPSSNNAAFISFETLNDSDVTISISSFLGLNIGRINMSLLKGRHQFQLSDLFNLPAKGSFVVVVEGLDSRLAEIVIIR